MLINSTLFQQDGIAPRHLAAVAELIRALDAPAPIACVNGCFDLRRVAGELRKRLMTVRRDDRIECENTLVLVDPRTGACQAFLFAPGFTSPSTRGRA